MKPTKYRILLSLCKFDLGDVVPVSRCQRLLLLKLWKPWKRFGSTVPNNIPRPKQARRNA
jgi:hypothetical protein